MNAAAAAAANSSTYELQKLSHRHDAIVEWLVANGDKGLGDCARFFNYSLPWLSRIVGSDMFQAKYQELCRERQVESVHALGTKIAAAAHLALDRLTEHLAIAPSEKLLMAATDTLLDKLGYTSGGGAALHLHRHEHLHGLTPEDIDTARLKAAARARELNSQPVNSI